LYPRCTYCFSRPTHEYLGYGAALDFDRKIIAKVNAPELLKKELINLPGKAMR
jgi:DNA repair photolyase